MIKIVAALFLSCSSSMLHAKEMIVYFGTGGKQSKGIYMSRLDMKTGKLSEPKLAVETTRPGFLAFNPDKSRLYAIGRMKGDDGKSTGSVEAYNIDRKTGKLTLINKQSTRGGVCHLDVDDAGKCVVVANYGGGSVVSYPIKEDGSIGPIASFIEHEGSSVTDRQKGPHAHSINVDPTGRFAVAADLGIDKVLVYKLDPDTAKLTPQSDAKVAPGAGPRHFTFHNNGKFGYVINELNGTITAFSYDSDNGKLKEIQTITTLPDGYKQRNSTAEIRMHPNGRFLYTSNRGHNTIAVFKVDPSTGKLTFV
ncbi:MAG: lactonase family protein, partial [Pirellulales bacterium]|nr:lactonase family protein [Pirellulales bacterium]